MSRTPDAPVDMQLSEYRVRGADGDISTFIFQNLWDLKPQECVEVMYYRVDPAQKPKKHRAQRTS